MVLSQLFVPPKLNACRSSPTKNAPVTFQALMNDLFPILSEEVYASLFL